MENYHPSAPEPDDDTGSEDSFESLDAAYARVLNLTQTALDEKEDVSEQDKNVQATVGPVFNISDEKHEVGSGFHIVTNYILHLHICKSARKKMIVAILCLIICVILSVVLTVLLTSVSPETNVDLTTTSQTMTISSTKHQYQLSQCNQKLQL